MVGGKVVKVNRKKFYRILAILLLGVALLGVFLERYYFSALKKEKKAIKVGITLYDATDSFISNTKDNIEYYIQKIEEETGSAIVLDIVDGQNNQEVQNRQIDTFIREGYDVIVANIVDRSAASTIIDKVKEAQIESIFFNREPVPQDMKKWDKLYYVGSSASEAGRMQGEILVEAIKKGMLVDKNNDGKIQYVMLEGEYGHQDAILRTYHCISVLEENNFKMDNLATDTGRWRRTEAKDKMAQWLEAFDGEIELVLSNNDEMALGAIAALKEKGYFTEEKWMPILGVDGIEEALGAIEEGFMVGTVYNNSDEQARSIVAKIYEIIEGSKPALLLQTEEKDNYFWVKHNKITKENTDIVKKHNTIDKK